MIRGILIAAVVAAISGAFFVGMDYGAKRMEHRQLKYLAKQQKKWAQELEAVRQQKDKVKVVYRDKVKIIREAVDECADTRVPDPILCELCDHGDCPGQPGPACPVR